MNLYSLNEKLNYCIQVAQSCASEYGNSNYSAPHLLFGLLNKNVGLRPFIASLADLDYIIEWTNVRLESLEKTITNSPIEGEEGIVDLFELADRTRVRLGLEEITPMCLFIAILRPGLGFSVEQLQSFPIKERDVLDRLIKDNKIQSSISPSITNSTRLLNTAFLQKFCTEKTHWQSKRNYCGREQEIRHMKEIMGRKFNPNVLIIGESGVGKTALVESYITLNAVEKFPFQIFELDLGNLTSGINYKGEIEDRLKAVIKELKQWNNSVLFIDDFHHLLDNKSFSSSLVNVLKSSLLKSELTVIATTNPECFRKHIEKESSLNGLFDALKLEEPSIEKSIQMIEQIIPEYEAHYHLQLNRELIKESVQLSKRFLKQSHLPNSAINLIDRTLSSFKLMKERSKHDIDFFGNFISNLSELDFYDAKKEYQILWEKLNPLITSGIKKIEEITNEALIRSYTYQLTDIRNQAGYVTSSIEKQHLYAVISELTGIPMGKIQKAERERLMGMEEHLKQRVVGQNKAIKAVSEAVFESRSGMNKTNQPIGSLFFTGPTGTGKTELAKAVADFLFGDEKAIIRFDMSEFKEEHSAALLYGAPPGYVGYEEGGMLINKIRNQPYSVVLFDEIEKAHPSVFDIFLQLMDEGRLHDKLGKEGDFSNSLIIFTSNIGAEWINECYSNQLTLEHKELMEYMCNYFRPEFLARLTEIVPFSPISDDHLLSIFNIQINSLKDALVNQGINISISEPASLFIAKQGFTPKYGARQVVDVIRNSLRRPIAKMLLKGSLKRGDLLTINLNINSELDWKIINEIHQHQLNND